MTDMTDIQFDNGAIKMAGNLYLPDGFDEAGSYPAIVCVHPGGGVKEQTAGVYAQDGGVPRLRPGRTLPDAAAPRHRRQRSGSLWHSAELYANAPGPKQLVVIDGATHMDLYDYRVDEVVGHLSPFFVSNLGDPREAQLTASAQAR